MYNDGIIRNRTIVQQIFSYTHQEYKIRFLLLLRLQWSQPAVRFIGGRKYFHYAKLLCPIYPMM